jgi:DNA polymerase III delta subunit
LHTMLTRHVRALVMVDDCLNRKIAPNAIAAETELHPFVAQKAVFAVRQFPPGVLRQLFLDLLGLDVQMKTGQSDSALGLVQFIAKACTE